MTAGKIPHKYKDKWKDILFRTGAKAEAQGAGAAGVMSEFNDPFEFSWRKRPKPCGEFLKETLGDSTRTPNILAAHARSGYNYPDDREYDRNHHPFHGENIVLMHEGYADTNWFPVAEDMGIELETETDSELLMKVIDSEDNAVDGIKKALDTFPGWAIGIAVYDERTPGKMYFACNQNKCSPYHITRISELNCSVLISRFSMLRNACAGTDLEKFISGDILNVENNKVYVFDCNGKFTVE